MTTSMDPEATSPESSPSGALMWVVWLLLGTAALVGAMVLGRGVRASTDPLSDWVEMARAIDAASDGYFATVGSGGVYVPGAPDLSSAGADDLSCPQSASFGRLEFAATNVAERLWACTWGDSVGRYGVGYGRGFEPPPGVAPTVVDGAQVYVAGKGARIFVRLGELSVDWYAVNDTTDGQPVPERPLRDVFSSPVTFAAQPIPTESRPPPAKSPTPSPPARSPLPTGPLTQATPSPTPTPPSPPAPTPDEDEVIATFISQLQAMDDGGPRPATQEGTQAATFIDTYAALLAVRGAGGDGVRDVQAGTPPQSVTLPSGTFPIEVRTNGGEATSVSLAGSGQGTVVPNQYSGLPAGVEVTVDHAIVWPNGIWLATTWRETAAEPIGIKLGPLGDNVAYTGIWERTVPAGATQTVFDALCCDLVAPYRLDRFVEREDRNYSRMMLDVTR